MNKEELVEYILDIMTRTEMITNRVNPSNIKDARKLADYFIDAKNQKYTIEVYLMGYRKDILLKNLL